MSVRPKPDADFAALPPRMIGDRRCKLEHWRVAATIATFDRRSARRGKGGGCYASRDTLLEVVGCHPTNLSSAINDLGIWGYVEQFPSQSSARKRVYRIRYDDTASPSEGSLPFGKSRDGRNLPSDKRNDRDKVCSSANEPAISFVETSNLVCSSDQPCHSNSSNFLDQEILRSVRDSEKSVGIDAGEPARLSSRRSAKQEAFPRPEWADSEVWSDFLENRRKKKRSNHASAYKRFLSDIARLSSAEWPPERLLEHAAAQGWCGIYLPRDGGQGGTDSAWGAARNLLRGDRPDPALDLYRLGLAGEEAERQRQAVTERELAAQSAMAAKHGFRGAVIDADARLMSEWLAAFHAIEDLHAELVGIDAWLSGAGAIKAEGWRAHVPGMLNRKHQQVLAERREADRGFDGLVPGLC